MKDMADLHHAQAQITAQVIEIIAAQAMIDPADVTPQTPLADLALDSLAMVEIVFHLEEAFDITIPFDAHTPAFDLTSAASIAAAISALRG